MQQKDLDNFIRKLDHFAKWPRRQQVDYLAYFIATERNKDRQSFTVAEIEDCYSALSLKKHPSIAVYLSTEANKKRGGRYIKALLGYCLERTAFDGIAENVNHEPKQIHVSQTLQDFVSTVTDPTENRFLEKAINCYRVQAFRATIILVWILVFDHIQKYVFSDSARLGDFNKALAANPDKTVNKIVKYDDFSDLKESKIIEIMHSARIITKDVKRILNEKLGIRNSAAHPSAIQFDGHKATEFVSDLINNVLLKY